MVGPWDGLGALGYNENKGVAMYLDYENLFCNDQAITSVDGASTNVIDLGDDNALAPVPNEKGDVEILCQVTETFVGGTSLAITLQSDDDEAFGSATTLLTTPAIVTASLVAGYQFTIAVPREKITEQYLRLSFDVTGTMSAGKITAGLVLNRQTNG